MQRTHIGYRVGAVLVAVLMVAACGGGGAKEDQAKIE